MADFHISLPHITHIPPGQRRIAPEAVVGKIVGRGAPMETHGKLVVDEAGEYECVAKGEIIQDDVGQCATDNGQL